MKRREAAEKRFLRFDVGDDQISFPGTLGMRGQNHFEFDAELKIIGGAGDVFGEHQPGTGANYLFDIVNQSSTTYLFRGYVFASPFPFVSAVLNYVQIYRLTVSLKSNVLRLYIDGVYTSQVACNVSTNTFSYAPLMGRGNLGMDLYKFKLIAGNSLHNTNTNFPANEDFTATPGTAVLFDFSQTPPTQTAVSDLSASGNTGTLNNFANPATATSGWQTI